MLVVELPTRDQHDEDALTHDLLEIGATPIRMDNSSAKPLHSPVSRDFCFLNSNLVIEGLVFTNQDDSAGAVHAAEDCRTNEFVKSDFTLETTKVVETAIYIQGVIFSELTSTD